MSADLGKLKPCPFCGKAPNLEQSPNFGTGVWLKESPRPAEYMVCNIHCCHISIYKSEPVDHYEGNEKKCADKSFFFASLEWNRRAPSPEIEQAKADAARYRWLKHHCYDTEPAGEGDAFDFPSLHFEDQDLEPWDSDSLDLVIDAALQSQEVYSKESSPKGVKS